MCLYYVPNANLVGNKNRNVFSNKKFITIFHNNYNFTCEDASPNIARVVIIVIVAYSLILFTDILASIFARFGT